MTDSDSTRIQARDGEVLAPETPAPARPLVADAGRRLSALFRGRQIASPPAHAAGERLSRPLRRRPSLYLVTLALFVILPSLASQIYLVFLASDQYLATGRFAVRAAESSESPDKAALAAMGQGGGLNVVSLMGQDAYVVVAYIRSRAIVDDLLKTIDLRTLYRREGVDFWARLPANASAEDLTKYWQTMTTAAVDGPSGIVTIYVRAFTPDDAVAIAKAVITASESLVNAVAERARRDAVSRAEDEVRRNQALVQGALDAMRDFRQKIGYVDPGATASITAKLLTDLLGDKIRIENDLFVAQRSLAKDAPMLEPLRSNLQTTTEQIDRLKATLTGNSPDGKSLAASLVTFESLELKRLFAEKLYSMSQDALERARVKAERQNIYVSVFVPPALPEDARYPERLAFSIIIPITLLVIWGIGALLVATIQDHRH